jgi:antirestriction protein ArdC
MDWYIVIKTIKGHRYRYRQKTWREGKRVRTRSEYLGPAIDSIGEQTIAIIALRAQDDLLKEHETTREWEQGWDEELHGYAHSNLVIDNLIDQLQVHIDEDTDGPRYSPDTDRIIIPPRENFVGAWDESPTECYYSTLLHELVHWTGYKSRVKRSVFRSPYSEEKYAREELVAELGSVMLMKYFGMLEFGIEIHADYFQAWLSRAGDRTSAMRYANRQAKRAVRFILERGIISQ